MNEKISIISTCYNEEENIEDCYNAIKNLFYNKDFEYEHIFIDNNSSDKSRFIIEKICRDDIRVKAIFNTRNYGPFLSNFNALKYVNGDFIIVNFACDMQDPPEVISEMIIEINKGFDVVYAVKKQTDENYFLSLIRNFFYFIINKFSSYKYQANVNEFICCKKFVIDEIIKSHDYFPYIRAYFRRITEKSSLIYFNRRKRNKGRSKNNFLDLYGQAINGLISTMDIPVKILSFGSFIVIIISCLLIFFSIIIKLISPEIAPKGFTVLLIAILSFFSITIFILSICLEYIIAIHNQVRFRHNVIIEKKINF